MSEWPPDELSLIGASSSGDSLMAQTGSRSRVRMCEPATSMCGFVENSTLRWSIVSMAVSVFADCAADFARLTD